MNVNSGFERNILNHESWLVALVQIIHKYDSDVDHWCFQRSRSILMSRALSS